MPTTLTECPSCGRKLRLPDHVLGRNVQCPACSSTFVAQVQPSDTDARAAPLPTEYPPNRGQPAAAAHDAPVPELSLDDESTAVRPTGPLPSLPQPLRPVLIEEELTEPPAGTETGRRPCPHCGEVIPTQAGYCRFCGEDLETGKAEWDRRGNFRRDWEPHRGGLIVTLGIIGLIASILSVFAVVGLPLSITVWVMADADLKLMRDRRMDPEGMANTQGGKVCAIFGTVIGCLWLTVLCCGGRLSI